ncbi:MAG: hypothetical protein AB7G11_03060 [Phycisphaerales bacterium]
MQTPSVISNITIEPSPDRWLSWLSSATVGSRAHRFREQLGLRADTPVIMSGHQAGFWHPGILAKYLAMEAASAMCLQRGLVNQTGWVCVDQDDNDAGLVRFPIRDPAGRLRECRWNLAAGGGGASAGVKGAAVSSQPSRAVPAPPDFDGEPALPSVPEALERIRISASRHSTGCNFAQQLTRAALDLVREIPVSLDAGPAPHQVFATRLARTDLFAELMERLLADPARCVRAYNDAAARHPEAGIARLRASGRIGLELPLWHLGAPDEFDIFPVSPRTRVTNLSLSADPAPALAHLAPRALLMTAMLRLAGCDLFIHGTGGAAYDRVTEQWIGDWLGESLAPTGMVTATMLLPLAPPQADALAAPRAAWFAHRARHDPALLGDHAAATEKARLVRAIRDARARGERPLSLYRRMHELLSGVRAQHSARLDQFAQAARTARAAQADAALAADRTWPFPLFPPEDLGRLATRIAAPFLQVSDSRAG